MPDAAPGLDGFEPVAIVCSMPEASVLLATLRAYGIHALPRNQAHVSITPSLMIALGGICVAVPPTQLDDAVALLSAIDEGWTCPPPPLARNGLVNGFLSVLMTVFLGAPPMPRAPGLYRWRRIPVDEG
jgi:hypothetical protein